MFATHAFAFDEAKGTLQGIVGDAKPVVKAAMLPPGE